VEVKVKAKCCKDGPRCKRCPVVYKRLEEAGLAVRKSKRRYVLLDPLAKKDLKPYRARKV
jgi:hypothetical protein